MAIRLMQLKDIIRFVENTHGLPRGILVSKCRDRRLAQWRHFAMFLARRETNFSYPEIGRAFKRHHTTVMYAVEKWSQRDLSLRDDF